MFLHKQMKKGMRIVLGSINRSHKLIDYRQGFMQTIVYQKENCTHLVHSLFCYQYRRPILSTFGLFVLMLFLLMLPAMVSPVLAASVKTSPVIAQDAFTNLSLKKYRVAGNRYVTVRIDLDRVNLVQQMIDPETGNNYASFSQLQKKHDQNHEQLLFAINSGIYSKEFTPLGLYIENGKRISPLNRIKSNEGKGNFALLPNGVFYITKNNRAAVLDTDAFNLRFKGDYANIRDAVQSGPMLLINGEYNPYFFPESDSYRIRSGVCALEEGREVVFVVTEDNVNFYQFARFFKEELRCENALYLDGTLARIYYEGRIFGASFWQAKPLVGIWSVIKPQ